MEVLVQHHGNGGGHCENNMSSIDIYVTDNSIFLLLYLATADKET